VEPTNFVANFNLGAQYNNLAKKYFEQANQARGAEEARIKGLQQENLALAYKYMAAALAAKPNDCSTLRALKNICSFYTERLNEVGNYTQQLQAAGCGN
jgi:hypothetical protein